DHVIGPTSGLCTRVNDDTDAQLAQSGVSGRAHSGRYALVAFPDIRTVVSGDLSEPVEHRTKEHHSTPGELVVVRLAVAQIDDQAHGVPIREFGIIANAIAPSWVVQVPLTHTTERKRGSAVMAPPPRCR